MTDLLVVHDLGAEGGRPWAEAFAGWDGAVAAPDLPGHGAAPPPAGGHHEAGDAVFALVDHLSPPDGGAPIVVGVGTHGFVARTFALGGRARALVLVDGLGGPWLDVLERNAALRDARRAILATPEALAPHRPGTTDVRATLVAGPMDRDHELRMLGSIPVPTLVVETPSSSTPDADADAAVIPDHTLVRVADSAAATVAAAVTEWWVTTRSTDAPG
ncbi:alpha/beta fold hydrolase [Actinospongicola halichondriae]|uniref:alpha/beta fold hydrolase n=1 Tax=Actinospongicola halichondriae TaxID=3236844 RepID=UPI003D499ACB